MRTILLTVACLAVASTAATTSERLSVRVTPAAAVAPAYMVLQAIIDRSADNRQLKVVAESSTYYRSSEMTLDGDRAARVNEFRFRGFPEGRYEITVTLIGAQGRRAVDNQWFQVVSGGDR